MILSEEIITVLFRLLNFAVLAYGLHYVYIHYICSAVRNSIGAAERKVAILAQQKDAYYQQEQFVAQEIQDQEKTVSRLIEKLEQWRIATDDAERAQSEEHARLELVLRKKVAVQSEHIGQYMLERRALPHAMHELRISMADHFKSDKRGGAYIASVVNHIDKDR
jgi:hypothetical protein